MRAVATIVAALQGCERVRLVLVQFASPFGRDESELEFQSDIHSARFCWKDRKFVEARKARFLTILAAIKADGFIGTAPSVVVFPEYSVPKECHEGLQAFADLHRCIIVPGSYYEADGPALKSNNVCRIFLPKQDPVTIVKKHGFRHETRALKNPRGVSHVAHLVGSNSVLGEFSISVFICRDYLAPYYISGRKQVSVTDWRRPGLNVVTMCSSHMHLFESQASFDISGLRGRRRVVALCNCAGVGVEGKTVLGTAILGPTNNEDKQGATIESIQGDDEGVIVADVMLNQTDLARIETKPVTEVFVPVIHEKAYSISSFPAAGELAKIALKPIRPRGFLERGVWHPAFLEYVHRKIAICVFRARKSESVRQHLDNDLIFSVSAYAVEGINDFLMRYYKSAETTQDFWESRTWLSREDFNSLFFPERDGRIGMELIVEPKDIIKYRTVPIVSPIENDSDWSVRYEEIDRLIPAAFEDERRRQLLRRISRLSENWWYPKISDSERAEVAPVFLEKRELVPSVASIQSGMSNLRQKFVLISVGTADQVLRSKFESEIVVRQLLPLEEIRSIYRVNVNFDGVQFDYWVDVIAEAWMLAKIILGITRSAHQMHLDAGTRSMEVLEYYNLDSVQGVYTTDFGRDVIMFIEKSRRVDPVIVSTAARSAEDRYAEDRYRFLSKCAKAWYVQSGAPKGKDIENLSDEISKFYVYLYWANVCEEGAQRRTYINKAADAWNYVFRELEARFEHNLIVYLGLVGDQNPRTAATEKLRHLGVSEKELEKSDVVEQALHFAGRNEKSGLIDGITVKQARQDKKIVFEFRNKVTHSNKQRQERLRIEWRGKDPRVWTHNLIQ